jgi:hypothetical protein
LSRVISSERLQTHQFWIEYNLTLYHQKFDRPNSTKHDLTVKKTQ